MKLHHIASSLPKTASFSLNQENQDKGFTLIELLVVIIIIGILSAIALPSFLNQANKAKESEAKQYVGSGNRANQAFFLEHSHFTTDINKLGLGISTQTANYAYQITATAPASYEDVQVATMWSNVINKDKYIVNITIEPDGTICYDEKVVDTAKGLHIFIGNVYYLNKDGTNTPACLYKARQENGVLVKEIGGCRNFIEAVMSKKSAKLKIKMK